MMPDKSRAAELMRRRKERERKEAKEMVQPAGMLARAGQSNLSLSFLASSLAARFPFRTAFLFLSSHKLS